MTQTVNQSLAETVAVQLQHKLDAYDDFIGLYLYGSCVKGDATPESDIDIVAVFEEPKDHDRQPLKDAWELEIAHDVVIDFHALSESQLRQNGLFYNEIKKGIYYGK